MSMHHSSVECPAPKNCPPFDEVCKKDDLHKIIEVYQDGSVVFRREGKLKIVHESEDKIIFEDSSGARTKVYNKNGVIIITNLEIAKGE